MASSASNPTQAGRAQKTAPVRRRRRALKSGLAVILLIILASVGYGLLAEGDRSSANESVPTAEVMRGDLTVTVEERGDVYSMRPLEIKSQVEGRNTLLELVDEGTVLTQKDVDEGRVIARLDSSTLEETVADRQISVFQAEASYVQAKEDHDIQVNQCKSNIAAAELKLKFARLDAERYLGSDLAIHMLAPDAGPVDLIALARAAVEQLNAAAETGVQAAGETAEQAPAAADESDPPMLGGDAEQQLRTLTTQVQLAAKELAQAQDQLDWSQKLAARDYISTNDLEGDQLRAQRAAVRLRTAQEGLSLFLNYTLQKDAEQNLSDCTEAQRNLERVQARSRSQLTQSEANLKSKEASFNLEKDRLQKAETMLANCTIRAPKPGRVAYGSSAGGSWGQRGRGQVNIELGAAIPENQVILRIPDTSALSVKVNISEKDIDKVAVGQPAIVTLEATPGKALPARVARISPMASATNAWLNPDTKVYEAEVALLAVPGLFIPGMSAHVRIVVGELKDVTYMPVQAVMKEQGYSICWVKGAERPIARKATLGLSTGTLVEVKGGVRPGEWVYLAPPDNASQKELATLIETLKSGSPEEETGTPGAPPGPPGAPAAPGPDVNPEAAGPSTSAQAGDQAAGGEFDWRAAMRQLRNLSEEERAQKTQEILQKMTPEQRQQYEQRAGRMQNMSPEDRQRMRGQRGGGGQGGRGQGGRGQRPAPRPAEQGDNTDGTG